MIRRLLSNQRGFTLAELLVVTAVLGLTLAAVGMLMQKGQQAYSFGSNRVEAQQNARVALDLMTRELRSAQSITTLGSATDLTFTICDPSSMTTCTPVTVQYQLSGANLNRISGGNTLTIIGGVDSLTMTYCTNWDPVTNSCTPPVPATNAAQVKVIRVALVAKTEDAAQTGSLADRRMTVESTIRLRNVNNS